MTDREQKPVAWRYRGNLHEFDPSDWAEGPVTPLYAAPRQWVGLNDEEYQIILDQLGDGGLLAFYNLIELKLREKNGG